MRARRRGLCALGVRRRGRWRRRRCGRRRSVVRRHRELDRSRRARVDCRGGCVDLESPLSRVVDVLRRAPPTDDRHRGSGDREGNANRKREARPASRLTRRCGVGVPVRSEVGATTSAASLAVTTSDSSRREAGFRSAPPSGAPPRQQGHRRFVARRRLARSASFVSATCVPSANGLKTGA